MVEVEAALYPDKAHGQHMPRAPHGPGLFVVCAFGWHTALAELEAQAVNAAHIRHVARSWMHGQGNTHGMPHKELTSPICAASMLLPAVKREPRARARSFPGEGRPRRKRQRAGDLRCTCDLSCQITALP